MKFNMPQCDAAKCPPMPAVKPPRTTPDEIPQKLAGFDDFCMTVRQLALVGTDKYAGKEKDCKETIDIIPEILGEDGYKNFVLGDLLKRVFRLHNQFRERDLFKIALWCYLLWLRYYYNAEEESK